MKIIKNMTIFAVLMLASCLMPSPAYALGGYDVVTH